MADGHFQDVELLRRELAALILEWAGKSVKDDPDGPMSTALTRAVGEAARGAVAEQHQALSAEAADRIADALDRRDRAAGLLVLRLRPWVLGLIAVTAAALLALAFLLGQQAGRTETDLPPAPAAASVTPMAPIAPTVDEPAQAAAQNAPAPKPAARPERAAPAAAKPAKPSPPRELGRPAQTNEAAPRSTQPVGAAPATPPATTPATTP